MRTVTAPGRWIWVLSGLIAAVALAVPGTVLITSAGQTGQAGEAQPQSTAIRTMTVTQPVTSLTVQSYGASVQVTGGPVSGARITEIIMYDSGSATVAHAVPTSPLSAAGGPGQPASGKPGGPGQPDSGKPGSAPPAVAPSMSGGHLSLADPACEDSACSISFSVVVPPSVSATVVTQGGPVTVSGIARANLESDGGPVSATKLSGALTVNTGGGSLQLDGVAGPLTAGTDGGPLSAGDIASATVAVGTGGGDASMVFSVAPDMVTVSTDGGAARLKVPGGPYALAANTDGGPQSVGIATDPVAPRLITLATGGGSLQIDG